nr:MAG TPA: hypothetical protein [Caudoviricetes sp.]
MTPSARRSAPASLLTRHRRSSASTESDSQAQSPSHSGSQRHSQRHSRRSKNAGPGLAQPPH